MDNFIVIAVVVLILGCAITYIVKEKKKGVKCVGCPYAESCGKTSEKCSFNLNINK